MNGIERFTFFNSYAKAAERFKYKESSYELYDAIVAYMFYDKEPNFSRKELEMKLLAWDIISPTLNASKNKSKNAKKENQA